MKLAKFLLLSGASFLAMTAQAAAEPISFAIGNAIISALTAFPGVATFLSPILPAAGAVTYGNIALGILSIGANIAMALNRPKINPGQYKGTFEENETPEINAIGRVRVGGLKAFGNANGNELFRLVLHARRYLVGIEEYHLGGRNQIVDIETGAVLSPPWIRPTTAGTRSWAFLKTKEGLETDTAWEELKDAFPTLWTDDHTIPGIAHTLCRFLSPGYGGTGFAKLYPDGRPPEMTITGRFRRIYDPRIIDLDIEDEYSWPWSDNGVLCPTSVFMSFPGVVPDDIDWELTAIEADKADTIVATLAGTEKLSRCWGIWNSDLPRVDLLQQILESTGTELVMTTAGKFYVRIVDDARESDISFNEERNALEWRYKAGPEAVERPNIVRVRYYSPERNYEVSEIDLTNAPWARIQSEINAYGKKYFDCQLPFCPSAAQAQRIARLRFNLMRGDHGTARMNFSGIAAWGMSMMDLAFETVDDTVQAAIVNIGVDDDGEEKSVEIDYIRWPDLAPWDPGTMECPAPEDVPDIEYETGLAQPDAPTEAVIVEYPNGRRELRVKFNATGGTIREVFWRAFDGDGNPDLYRTMRVIDTTHAYQPIRNQMVINGDFTVDSDWTYGTGWSYGTGHAVAVAGSLSSIYQTFGTYLPLLEQDGATEITYQVNWTIFDVSGGGTIRPQLTPSAVDGATVNADGTYSEELQPLLDDTHDRLSFQSSSTFNGKLDNVTMYEVGAPDLPVGTHIEAYVRIFDGAGNASYPSDPFDVASIAIDNTPCATIVAAGVPNGDLTGTIYAFTVPEIRAVRWETDGLDTEESGIVKLGQENTLELIGEDLPANVTFVIYTSDGTPSV